MEISWESFVAQPPFSPRHTWTDGIFSRLDRNVFQWVHFWSTSPRHLQYFIISISPATDKYAQIPKFNGFEAFNFEILRLEWWRSYRASVQTLFNPITKSRLTNLNNLSLSTLLTDHSASKIFLHWKRRKLFSVFSISRLHLWQVRTYFSLNCGEINLSAIPPNCVFYHRSKVFAVGNRISVVLARITMLIMLMITRHHLLSTKLR